MDGFDELTHSLFFDAVGVLPFRRRRRGGPPAPPSSLAAGAADVTGAG